MPLVPSRTPVLGGALVLLLASVPPAAGQLPSPARDAAEELLEVVRTGDRARIRAFLEERFTPGFVGSLPVDEHVPILASLGRQVAGLEVAEVGLDGETRVTLGLEGPGGSLEMRLTVESVPPHRIRYLGWGRAGPDLRARSLDDLGADLERLADRPPFSGVVLVAEGGEVLFHRAYGSADLEEGRPNRPDTRFDMGSIGKLFTSVAVLRLARDGRLDLDDTLGEHLGGFPPGVADRVTVRHLLRHRSGFGDYLSHPEFEADPVRFREPADFLPLARRQELRFEPGARVAYSNMGFVLLGAVLESVTGRPYEAVIEELVYRPAGMVSAGPAGGEGSARRYELRDGRFVPLDSLYPDVGTPAGGGFAAATDLLRFVEALLDHRLLDERDTALLLNGFEEPADGGPPERFGFAGGAPGVNAVLRVGVPERRTVVVLANVDPWEVEAMARSIEGLAVRNEEP